MLVTSTLVTVTLAAATANLASTVLFPHNVAENLAATLTDCKASGATGSAAATSTTSHTAVGGFPAATGHGFVILKVLGSIMDMLL